MDSNDEKEPSDNPSKSIKHDVDFTVFNDTDQCTGDDPKNKRTPNLKKCSSVSRVIYALKYYMAITKKIDKVGVSTFTDFIKSLYQNYINDITHLTEAHSSDLEDIHKSLFNEHGFKSCDLRKCKISGRHSDVKGTGKLDDSIPIDDALSQFIVDSFDSVHFYLFHLFDVGLRTQRVDIDSEQKGDDEIEDDDEAQSQCIDRAFLRRKRRQKAVRNELSEYFQRFQGGENKFVISGQNVIREDTGSNTYFDRLIDSLGDCINNGQQLRQYLMEHGFDTEAIRDDVDRYPNESNSNIFGVLDKKTSGKIAYFVNRRRRMSCCPLMFMYYLFHSVPVEVTQCTYFGAFSENSAVQGVQHRVHVDVLAMFCTKRRRGGGSSSYKC